MTKSFILPKKGDLILLKKAISGNLDIYPDEGYDDYDGKGLPPSPVFFMPDTTLLVLEDAKLFNENNDFFVFVLKFMFSRKIYFSSIIIYNNDVEAIYDILK